MTWLYIDICVSFSLSFDLFAVVKMEYQACCFITSKSSYPVVKYVGWFAYFTLLVWVLSRVSKPKIVVQIESSPRERELWNLSVEKGQNIN